MTFLERPLPFLHPTGRARNMRSVADALSPFRGYLQLAVWSSLLWPLIPAAKVAAAIMPEIFLLTSKIASSQHGCLASPEAVKVLLR
jgi:hypothetical protein